MKQFLERKFDVIGQENNVKVEDYLAGNMEKKSPEAMKIWTARQAYIALGNLLAATAEMRIDACPMEGFSVEQFDEILGLSEMGLRSTVIATVGYRSEEDQTQHVPKVRRAIDDLFIRR